MSTEIRHRAYGLVTVVVLGLAVVAGYGAYTEAFTDRVVVTVRADRSGLLLEEDSDVALRRVDIGKVLAVTEEGPDDVMVSIGIDAEHAEFVPADVSARVVSSTLLAPKYVDLLTPAGGTTTPIREGEIIQASAVQTEINVAFDNLLAVLDVVDPAQLNTALGALSTTLQGRGDPLGRYLQEANQYFEMFDPSLPTLSRDLVAGADVAGVYSDVAPDLLQILDATTTTGGTVVERQAALDAFLVSITRLGSSTRTFLEDNGDPLADALEVLRPSTALAARYAPIFPCLFATVNQFRRSVEPASGGTYPGLYTSTTPIPGSEPYRAESDLPVVAADEPTCSGGPISPDDGLYPRVSFDDGSPPLDTADAPVEPGSRPLAVMLFGEAAAEELTR